MQWLSVAVVAVVVAVVAVAAVAAVVVAVMMTVAVVDNSNLVVVTVVHGAPFQAPHHKTAGN